MNSLKKHNNLALDFVLIPEAEDSSNPCKGCVFCADGECGCLFLLLEHGCDDGIWKIKPVARPTVGEALAGYSLEELREHLLSGTKEREWEDKGPTIYCDCCGDRPSTRTAHYGDDAGLTYEVCGCCMSPCTHPADPHAAFQYETEDKTNG